MPFDEILDEVASGRADAGLLIHEGQLTYEDDGLQKVVDLGEWWLLETGLPLPLGVERRPARPRRRGPVRRSRDVLRESIQCGLDNRDEALEYALQFGRGLDAALADRFVGMYVNELTQDYGDEGRQAVARAAAPRRGARRVPRARSGRLRPLTSRRERARSSSPRSARRSGATAARSRACGRTISPRSRSRRRSSARASTPREIEDVYFGCANQAGEDNRNVARMARAARRAAGVGRRRDGEPALRVGALGGRRRVPRGARRRRRPLRRRRRRVDDARAARAWRSPTRAFPRGDQTVWDTTLGWRFPNPRLEELFPLESMGETGENVAER